MSIIILGIIASVFSILLLLLVFIYLKSIPFFKEVKSLAEGLENLM